MSITHQCSKKIKTTRKPIILFSHALSSPLLSSPLSIHKPQLPLQNHYHHLISIINELKTTSITILFHPKLVKPPLAVVNAQRQPLGTNHH